ncbi:hypothetical protein BKA62DRAFT_504051 [Auriculariales sp. MPI-PUGE-AT-0066]|nr:hypothetical protein BKA62DRAFT_504051 [Auriculariales sp. MPI-PUGE-AT-0066]
MLPPSYHASSDMLPSMNSKLSVPFNASFIEHRDSVSVSDQSSMSLMVTPPAPVVATRTETAGLPGLATSASPVSSSQVTTSQFSVSGFLEKSANSFSSTSIEIPVRSEEKLATVIEDEDIGTPEQCSSFASKFYNGAADEYDAARVKFNSDVIVRTDKFDYSLSSVEADEFDSACSSSGEEGEHDETAMSQCPSMRRTRTCIPQGHLNSDETLESLLNQLVACASGVDEEEEEVYDASLLSIPITRAPAGVPDFLKYDPTDKKMSLADVRDECLDFGWDTTFVDGLITIKFD